MNCGNKKPPYEDYIETVSSLTVTGEGLVCDICYAVQRQKNHL